MKKKDREFIVLTDDKGIFNRAKELNYDDIYLYTSLNQLKETDKFIVYLYYFNEDTENSDQSNYIKHKEMREANKNIKFINICNDGYTYQKALDKLMKQKWIESSLISDGLIHETSTRNRCGNCHAKLVKGSKYCYVCGTKRGEGKFEPFFNEMLLVYGPPVTQIVTCKNCGYKFKIGSLGGKTIKYCPKCGKDFLNIEEKVFWYDDEDDDR